MNRVDVYLQYYRPHVSGLTNMAADLAEHAAAHGMDMHVHCVSQAKEGWSTRLDGVTVHAYRRSFTLGRAAFSIDLLRAMWRMRNEAGLAHVHMPYPESFYLAWVMGKGWRFLSTYQCDAPLSGGVGSLFARALDWSHRRLLKRTALAVVSSTDYAESSRIAPTLLGGPVEVVPVTGRDRAGGTPLFRVPGRRLVGFIGRPTHEKGIDTLLDALELLPLEDVSLLFAGPEDGLTERPNYDRDKFAKLVSSGKIIPVGFLEEQQIPDFYASLDLYVHPSINSFDAFGIVQLEAMSAGVPVVASDIPGVRTAVQTTGFGEITRAGDPQDLLRGLVLALESTYDVQRARAKLEEYYLPPGPQDRYLSFYRRLMS